MSKALAVRKKPTPNPVVISKALLNKNKLTFRERLWVYAWVPTLLLGAPLIALGTLFEVGTAGTLADLLFAAVIAAGGITSFAGLCMSIAWSDDELAQKRRKSVARTRLCLGAPHADQRLGRAIDVRYTFYVPYVYREGREINVSIKQVWHASGVSGGSRRYFNCEAVERFAVDTMGSFGHYEGKRIRVTEPTMEKVDGAYREVAEVAATLEEQAYQTALEERRIERLALIYKQPEGPLSERAKHYGEELDAEIEGLLKSGS